MSTARPARKPFFATDATFATGTEAGTPTKLDPGSSELARGHYPGNPTFARQQNYWQNLVYEWVDHLDKHLFVANESIVRNAIGHAAYEVIASGVPIPLRGACQFPVPTTSSSNRVYSPAGWTTGPTVPNFATATASVWSGAVDQDSNRALIAMTISSSIATWLCRFSAGAWATQDLPVAYLGAARAAFIGTQFFVGQADGAIYRSTTGATGSWSAATALPANTDYRHLDYVATNGTITIGCRGASDTPNGYILRTADGGSTWSAVLLPGTTPTVSGVAWDLVGAKFVAVGLENSVAAVWNSSDGITWTRLTITIRGSVVGALSDLVYIDGILVALDQLTSGAQAFTSRDGGFNWMILSQVGATSAGAQYCAVENGTDVLIAISGAPAGHAMVRL